MLSAAVMIGALREKNFRLSRVLDKREYFDDNFSYFSLKPYVVTPHLNRLAETVQMKGHNIYFMQKRQKLSLSPNIFSYLERVVRWGWVNFQFRGVLLIRIIVGQGPIALAVGAGGGC